MKTQKTPIRIMRTTMASAIAAIPLLLSQQADAQFTYTGGTLNVNQTYDGLGVDSALNPLTIGGAGVNNYIGDGSGVTGSITVQSGTLTINGNDMKIGQIPWGGVVSTGTVSVALGATLNINQIGQWGGGVGQRGVGIINIASGATLNWQTSGSIEQRFMFGNGPGGLGILNLNGGTLYNYFDPAQALNDDSRQFRVGSDSGAAIVNLNSGTWAMAGEVPFVLGATYTGMNSTPVLTQSATVSVINILNGSLIMSNACPVLDPNKASFVVGDNDFVNFIAGGTGYLSLTNWSLSDYQTLVDAGQIRVNSNTVTIASFAFSTDANGQGILKLSDPVATTPVISPTNTIYSGETVILSESAFGTAPFTYQWQSDNGSGGATFTDISGAVFASYTNNTTGFAVNSYQYRVIVTNALNATITSAPATLTVNAASAPFIVSDTAPATAVSRYQGGTITFTAAFDGNHPMTYQWQLDGNTGTFTNIPGANSATLTITNLQYTQAGNYRLAATNSVGDFASTPTALTVLNPAALQFTWSAPVSMNNLTANQILTNTLG
ncbi:MAG TPA: immunoglobulin domain-containing protein, partial [Candidatus Paceibacterota bacterium]|nr:immunoglobulin domain-containing protein [Candidatus Paceibacterota bacterium]